MLPPVLSLSLFEAFFVRRATREGADHSWAIGRELYQVQVHWMASLRYDYDISLWNAQVLRGAKSLRNSGQRIQVAVALTNVSEQTFSSTRFITQIGRVFDVDFSNPRNFPLKRQQSDKFPANDKLLFHQQSFHQHLILSAVSLTLLVNRKTVSFLI